MKNARGWDSMRPQRLANLGRDACQFVHVAAKVCHKAGWSELVHRAGIKEKLGGKAHSAGTYGDDHQSIYTRQIVSCELAG